MTGVPRLSVSETEEWVCTKTTLNNGSTIRDCQKTYTGAAPNLLALNGVVLLRNGFLNWKKSIYLCVGVNVLKLLHQLHHYASLFHCSVV